MFLLYVYGIRNQKDDFAETVPRIKVFGEPLQSEKNEGREMEGK